MACALVDCEANVAIIDQNPAGVDRIKEYLDHGPGQAIVIACDVLNQKTMLDAEEKILAQFGAVDILINAAGGNQPRATTDDSTTFFDLPVDAIRAVADLNFLGTLIPCQVFGKTMGGREQGVILNISSMNAFRPLTRIPAYSAAKAAVSNFTQWLAVYMAREYSANIRVNAIAPGFILTKQNRFLMVDEVSGKVTPRGRAILDHTPMARFGVPGDMIGTMLWLISPAAAFVTGAVIPIDGGFSAFSGV
jgi:NAD(P)-dependent dehydrogenase (short-subunit alcohol dehydrogenase family)